MVFTTIITSVSLAIIYGFRTKESKYEFIQKGGFV